MMARADQKYEAAMQETADVINRLRDPHAPRPLVIEIFKELWRERHNAPVMTTIYQAYQEMMSPVRQLVNGRLKH